MLITIVMKAIMSHEGHRQRQHPTVLVITNDDDDQRLVLKDRPAKRRTVANEYDEHIAYCTCGARRKSASTQMTEGHLRS